MSERTAVYRFYDAMGGLIYVGMTCNPERRWQQHRVRSPWWSRVRQHEIEWHVDRLAAQVAEAEAIWTENPQCNLVIPDPDDPMTWPPPNLAQARAEAARRTREARKAQAEANRCPVCGRPGALRPERMCARQDCGQRFRNRHMRAIYCSARCARIMAQRRLRERQRGEVR